MFGHICSVCVEVLWHIHETLRVTNKLQIKKKVREKSRECHNYKPQPFPDIKRKRKPTNPNKHNSINHMKSTKISSLFPKRGNRNAKKIEINNNTRTKWHKIKKCKKSPGSATITNRSPSHTPRGRGNWQIQTSTNRTNAGKALRLAISSPSEVIAILKGLKNTRTKWHMVRHTTNRLVE